MLRQLGLAAFARLNPGDVRIRHHYTGQPIHLHSFRHKGYWFHGRRRERDTMVRFAEVIHPGDCVVEAGGHIGYLSLYFAHLVGAGGAVHVFEPGTNNLPYLRRNLAGTPGATIVPKALGDKAGRLPMRLEDLTGQNNSLVPDFAGLAANERNAIKANVAEQVVEVVRLDDYVASAGIAPDVLKVDVEGFELEVLLGAAATLEAHRPALMVEVQRNRATIAELLHGLGYRLCLPDGQPITEIPDGTVNIFGSCR